MSLVFGKKHARNAAELAAQETQMNHLRELRRTNAQGDAQLAAAMNVGRTPADLYRAFDTTAKLEVVPAGHLATLTRLMQKSRSISAGKKLFEHSKNGLLGQANISLSGTKNMAFDKSDVDYSGTPMPVFDQGYGIDWRDYLAGQSEGYDQLMIDSQNAERSVMEKINSYLLDGDSTIAVAGKTWLGLRNDPSVANVSLGVNLTSSVTTGIAFFNEVKRVRDVLRLDNDCSNPIRVGVSREILSNAERPFDDTNVSGKTILQMVQTLTGIVEVYEDSALTGNQLVMYWDDLAGFHPVTGMALSSYPLPRPNQYDDYNFMKWAIVGFVAKSTYSGKKCALYAHS